MTNIELRKRFLNHYFMMIEFSEDDGMSHKIKDIKDDLQRNLILANIPANYHKYTVDHVLDQWAEEQSNYESIKLYEIYMSSFDKLFNSESPIFGMGLYISGTHGLAKTTAAAVVLKEAIRANRTAYFIAMNDLIEFVTSGWKNEVLKSKYNYIINNVDFLVVDDIGRNYQIQPGMSTQIFDRLFMTRSNSRKPTILTTNHSVRDSQGIFGESLLTLFKSSTFEIDVFGKDIRYENSNILKKKLLEGN